MVLALEAETRIRDLVGLDWVSSSAQQLPTDFSVEGRCRVRSQNRMELSATQSTALTTDLDLDGLTDPGETVTTQYRGFGIALEANRGAVLNIDVLNNTVGHFWPWTIWMTRLVPTRRQRGLLGAGVAVWTAPTTFLGHAVARFFGCPEPDRIDAAGVSAWLYRLAASEASGLLLLATSSSWNQRFWNCTALVARS